MKNRSRRIAIPRSDHLGYEMTGRQAMCIAIAFGFAALLLIFSVFTDNNPTVQNAEALLAKVPSECRNEARDAMIATLSKEGEVTMEHLQESIAGTAANCEIIRGLSATNRV